MHFWFNLYVMYIYQCIRDFSIFRITEQYMSMKQKCIIITEINELNLGRGMKQMTMFHRIYYIFRHILSK